MHAACPRPPSLAVSARLECASVRAGAVPKLWGAVTLAAPSAKGRVGLDVVVALDTSASMRLDHKLAFIQATIEYLLSKLGAEHTFSLIAFNHEVSVLAELLPCTPDNKAAVLALVHALEAQGSTNISDALFAGTRILAKRTGPPRVSTLMLFTDGLSNRGLSTQATLQSLERVRLPTACVFNTFGFGSDHDSKLLHAIAHRAQGVYYFVETKEQIASTFGECVAALLSTQAHEISVSFKCRDGARLVTLATPFKIVERQVAKEYDVSLELLYSGESKTLLFRLSLRKLDTPCALHPLLHVDVEYTNTLTGKRERVSTPVLSVARPAMALLERTPLILDQHLNRYAAATVITEAIEMAKKYQFIQAQAKIQEVIDRIQKSPSALEPYCVDLVQDLMDCQQHMANAEVFERRGIHCSHAYSSMYFMERSSGVTCRLRDAPPSGKFVRHIGYGYVTAEQEVEAQHAVDRARALLSGYMADSDGGQLVAF